MKVEEDTTSDDPCFKVRIAADIFAESRWNRDRRIAALIGAFAAMARPESRMRPDGELWDHPVTKQMLSHLLEQGSLTWDEEGFDCVYAATLLDDLPALPRPLTGAEMAQTTLHVDRAEEPEDRIEIAG